MAPLDQMREPLFGRPGNNPFCHHRVLELRQRGLRERLVQAEPAPDEPFGMGRFDLILEPIPPDGPGSP